MSETTDKPKRAPVGTCAADGSAHPYTLLKRCPDGRVISLNMVNEAALREHLEAMWQYTEGYSVVAVVSVPNSGNQGQLPQGENHE
jgi:molybdopterin-guanine dinucleotide biosynthesis protein A